MANVINTGNPVRSTFIVNKYSDIDGNDSRVAQDTPRGRLCFKDTNGRMVLPTSAGDAAKAVFPVDAAKPLNPGPYFDGPGLNGAGPYAVNDGSLNLQETDFLLDPDSGFQTPWPVGVKEYEIPPHLYNLPTPSGAKCLVYDEGTFTYGSGNYSGDITDFVVGAGVSADYTSGNEGKIVATASGGVAIGFVYQVDVFGTNTVTVKLRGHNAL